MARGTLITIEGLDGAGKSTLASALARELQARGSRVELLREPGGVELSERIRDLVKDPALAVAPRTEALLYAAARAQLVRRAGASRCSPQGEVVLLDRFVDSSLAYQGGGRELGVERGPRDQPLRHRRARARPHAAAAHLARRAVASASAIAPTHPTGSSSRASASSPPSPPPTRSSPPPSPSACACSTPSARPSRCSRTRSPRSRGSGLQGVP